MPLPTSLRPRSGPTHALRALLPRRVRSILALVLAVPLIPAAVVAFAAETVPDRPIRVVLGTPAGSGHDTSTRHLVEGLRTALGQSFVVENRPGADGMIAVRQVVAAAPDGFTVLAAVGSQAIINPAIYANPGYEVLRDLEPVSLVAHQPMAIAVHPSVPATTVRDLVAWSRAHPGTVNYGAGTSTFFLATESFKRRSGADLMHIPYNGGGPAAQALVAGTVQVAILPTTILLGHAEAGRVRLLAVSGPKRFARIPDVPTFTEAGYPEINVVAWYGYGVPANTPAAVVEKINQGFNEALRDPEVRAALEKQALQPVAPMTAAEVAALYASDTEKYAKVIREANIRLGD